MYQSCQCEHYSNNNHNPNMNFLIVLLVVSIYELLKGETMIIIHVVYCILVGDYILKNLNLINVNMFRTTTITLTVICLSPDSVK